MNKLVVFHMLHQNRPQVEVSMEAFKGLDVSHIVSVDETGTLTREGWGARKWCTENKAVLMNPHRGGYAHWGAVDVVLRAMQIALKSDGWEHLMWCSANCLPLRPVDEVVDRMSPRFSYFSWCNAMEVWWDTIGPRVSWIWDYDTVMDTPVRSSIQCDPDILGSPIYAGPDWAVLSREACEYLISDESQKYRLFFSHTRSAGEMFFATALVNSPLSERLVNWNPWYVTFAEGKSHPETLTMRDQQTIKAQYDMGLWFARKFDVTQDAEVISYVAALRGE